MTAATTNSRLGDALTQAEWYVQIAGFPYRFYSNGAPPTDADYTDVKLLANVTVGGVRADVKTGKVSGQPARVRIAEADLGSVSAALQALRRLDDDGATRRTALAATVLATGTADIQVASTSGWSAPGAFHLGQERITYTGVAAGPTRFTGITRATLGTLRRQHVVDSAAGLQPYVVSDVVSWRSRPAVLYVRSAGTRAPSAGAGWVQWVAGFLDGEPDLLDDSISVELSIVPWSAVLDKEIGSDALVASLARPYHIYTVGIADTVAHTQRWGRGEAVREATTATSAIASGAINASTESHADVFDVSLAATHPRRGRIVVNQNSAGILNTAVVPASPYTSRNAFATASPAGYPPAAISGAGGAGTANTPVQVVNLDAAERYYATAWTGTPDPGDEEVLRWPTDALGYINGAWRPGTNKGAGGMWADVQILPFHERANGPAFQIRMNSTLHAGAAEIDWGVQGAPGSDLVYPLRMAAPDSVYAAESPRNAWTRTERIGATPDNAASLEVFPIAGIADAYYHEGEPVLMLDRLVAGVSTSVAYQWQVRWTDYGGGEERTAYFLGTVTGAVTVSGDTVGYKVEIDDSTPLPSFGDWPGQPRARIRPIARWVDADPRVTLCELLTSTQGLATNGADDVQPFGLGVPSTYVDATQIKGFPMPPELRRWSLTVTEPKKAMDALGARFRTAGMILVAQLDQETGARKLRLASVGPASAIDSKVTLVEASWEPGRPAQNPQPVTNSWTYKLGKRANGTEYTAVFTDLDSVTKLGEINGATENLADLTIDAPQDPSLVNALLRGAFNLARFLFGTPRRRVQHRPKFPLAYIIDPGDVVTITHSRIVNADGSVGVSSKVVRVLEVDHDPSAHTSMIGMVLHPGAYTGWAPALRVETVSSATVVIVEANAYTSTTDPVTGAAQADLDFWAANDYAIPVPRGNWSGSAVQITAINTGTRAVTFAGAHGLAVGDTIRPADYGTGAGFSSTTHKTYGYAADANGQLGAANAAGYNLA